LLEEIIRIDNLSAMSVIGKAELAVYCGPSPAQSGLV